MKVKKYLKLEKEADGRGPHKSLCTSSKGTEACQEARLSKLSRWCFSSTQQKKHHPCKIPSEYQSPYFLCIVVAMSDNLSDQIAHAKVCSSYHYSNKNWRKRWWPKVVKFVKLGNIINNSSSKEILRIFKILDYNLVRCKRHRFTFTWINNLINW